MKIFLLFAVSLVSLLAVAQPKSKIDSVLLLNDSLYQFTNGNPLFKGSVQAIKRNARGSVDAGYQSINTGFKSVTLNSNTQALNCTNCLSAGQNTIVRGNGAAGFGADGEANGNYSFIANDANFVHSESGSAFGFGNLVTGQNGFAWGNNNKVSGADGLALGGNLWSNAYHSMILGYGRTKVIQNPESNSVLITNELASIWIRQNGDIDITGNVKINGVAFNPAIARQAQIPQEQPHGKYMVMTTSGQLLYIIQIK